MAPHSFSHTGLLSILGECPPRASAHAVPSAQDPLPARFVQLPRTLRCDRGAWSALLLPTRPHAPPRTDGGRADRAAGPPSVRASRARSATVFSVVLPYSPANLGVGAVLASVAPLSRLPGAATAKRHSLKPADTHPLTVLGAGSLKPGRRKRWFFPEASAGESSPCLCSRVRRLLAILATLGSRWPLCPHGHVALPLRPLVTCHSPSVSVPKSLSCKDTSHGVRAHPVPG